MSLSDSSEGSDSASDGWDESVKQLDALTNDPAAIKAEENQPTLRRLLSHLCDVTNVPTARWYTEPVLKDVAAAGAAECISRIYKHSSDVGALRQAARLGRHLSRQKDNKELMATNQRLENAVYALEKHHPKDLIVAQHLLVVLGNLAHSDDNKMKLKELEAFKLVASVMSTFGDNRGIQHYGSTFIYNIATYTPNPNASEQYVALFQGNGLITALAHSIRTFPEDQESMPWALHALKFLTTHNSLHEECVNGGVIEACCEHFKSSPLDSAKGTEQELKHSAESLGALICSRTCAQSALRILMGTKEIMPTLIKVMNCHWTTRHYLSSVLNKIVKETPVNEDLRKQLDDCPVSHPVLTFLSKSLDNTQVLSWGLKKLYKMAYSGNHRNEIFKSGGLETLLTVFERYRNDEHIMETASGVLWLLCFREDCQRQIKGRETVATMLDDIRRTYNRNGHIQERANAIFKLAKITPPG